MEVEPFRVGVDPPLQTAHGPLAERAGFLVRVDLQGIGGLGEATPLPGWTESLEECREALTTAGTVAAELDWGIALRRVSDTPAARHGLALALADARARSGDATADGNERHIEGQSRDRTAGRHHKARTGNPHHEGRADGPDYPGKSHRQGPDVGDDGTDSDGGAGGVALYRSLGGPDHVGSVPVNATIDTAPSPSATATEATAATESGFDCLKVKVGTRPVEEDIERVRAVRDAVGDGVELRVDANGAWTTEEAVRAVEALAALDVAILEQPLPASQTDECADLRGRGVSIALDESLTVHDVETLVESGVADVLVLKPMVLGGPDLTVEAANHCRAGGLEPVVTTTFDAVVARTGAVHAAAAIPGTLACGLATADRIVRDVAPDPTAVSDGRITVPQEPGLGLRERP